jgi:hypothetical protein
MPALYHTLCIYSAQVSAEFAGPTTKRAAGSNLYTVAIFQPFAPMRAKGLTRQLQQIEPAMQGHPFVMDIKVHSPLHYGESTFTFKQLDGERMICHKEDKNLKWITRNTNDYSEKYGPVMNRFIIENVRFHLNCLRLAYNRRIKRFSIHRNCRCRCTLIHAFWMVRCVHGLRSRSGSFRLGAIEQSRKRN